MGKPYFILTGTDTDNGARELIFGDYDREVVAQERRDMIDSYCEGYKSLRVHRVPGDRQVDIDAFVRELNA